jgi:hypothetical protein
MEIRNCSLRMANPKFAEWLDRLSQDGNFQQSIDISDESREQKYDLELATRFLAFRRLEIGHLSKIGDINQFVDERILGFAESNSYDYATEERAFRDTFRVIAESLGELTFRRYSSDKQDFRGRFLISAYEVLAIGLGYHQPLWNSKKSSPIEVVARRMWEDPEFTKNTGAGVGASTRVRKTIPLGRRYFSKPPGKR